MSTYVREKVLRIPVDKIELYGFNSVMKTMGVHYEDDYACALESTFPALFEYTKPGKFQIAPTTKSFIDYVLEYEWDADGEFGKVRELYDNEKKKYFPIFKQIDPCVSMDDVRLVEFCWYNATEAPSYYDNKEDPFYAEV